MREFDVLIAGAGPAGAATAIMLAQVAPELRVCIVDAAATRACMRIGESVPPLIAPFLSQLGLWQRFQRDGHARSYRTSAAWGSDRLVTNEFLLSAHHCGWRLDRARFDRSLLEAAVERGARHVGAPVSGVVRCGSGWSIACGTADTRFRAAAVVDATGRAAAVSRMAGVRAVTADRLAAYWVPFSDPRADCDGPLIEATADGWWYSVAVPGERRVIACMTDPDIAHAARLRDIDAWMSRLAGTRHVGATVNGCRPLCAPRPVPAGSRRLAADGPAQAPLAVGDAAACYDPISGQGILKALRSGIFAAYALADHFVRRDERGIARYRSWAAQETAAYARTLTSYYAQEGRWPAQPFWRRRHPGAPQEPEPASLRVAAIPA